MTRSAVSLLAVTPLRIGFNKPLAIALLVVGALLLVISLALGKALTAAVGGILALLGILQLVQSPLVITSEEVQVRNPLGMTLRRFPVSSPSDLRIEGKRLMHMPTGKKVYTLGAAVNPSDVQKLRQLVAAQN